MSAVVRRQQPGGDAGAAALVLATREVVASGRATVRRRRWSAASPAGRAAVPVSVGGWWRSKPVAGRPVARDARSARRIQESRRLAASFWM